MAKQFLFVVMFCCFQSSALVMAVQNDNAAAKIELLGTAAIAGTAIDKSGLDQPLGAGFTNQLLGGFSAIAYSGTGNRYYVLPDRGPLDGNVNWFCRVQHFDILIDPAATPVVSLDLVKTTLLTDHLGHPFLGSAGAIDGNEQHAARLDPEGICVGANGNLFISDEYGPHVLEFRPDGRFVRQLSVPQRFSIKNPRSNSDDENPVNEIGRQANRGMEGLAISRNGQTLFGLMQSPLLQDCERTDSGSFPQGQNCRLLQLSVNGAAPRETLYHLDEPTNGLNEIIAVSKHRFIVIERDGNSGVEAKFKKLMLVSTSHATDISDHDQLSPIDVPAGIRPLSKSVLVDLLDPQWKLAGADMPAKFEALTFGPDLPDGRKTLIVGSDNDFEPKNPSLFCVFAMPKNSLFGEKSKQLESLSPVNKEF